MTIYTLVTCLTCFFAGRDESCSVDRLYTGHHHDCRHYNCTRHCKFFSFTQQNHFIFLLLYNNMSRAIVIISQDYILSFHHYSRTAPGGLVVVCLPGVQEVVGSIPDQVIPKTLKMGLSACLLSARH